MPPRKLSDILQGKDHEQLASAWEATTAAAELGPLPAGEYLCRVLCGEASRSKNDTLGYKLTLEVTEGEHTGRRCWHDLWFTQAAIPYTKRDLAKIGVERLEQLDQPLPRGILLRVRLALRKDDNGKESNRVVRLEAAGIEPGDAFAPSGDELPADATAFDPAALDGEPAPADPQSAPPPTAADDAQMPSSATDGTSRAPKLKRDPLPVPGGNGRSGSDPGGY